jgi:hypothetical protein
MDEEGEKDVKKPFPGPGHFPWNAGGRTLKRRCVAGITIGRIFIPSPFDPGA